MKKEKAYNEAINGDEGFEPGDGYPSCDGEPCANVSDEPQDGTDTMEFDNYRKRTLKEKMDLVQTGGRDVLLAMLPVRDDVQRAVDAMQKSDDIEALRAGVNLISQKFTETLRQKGVTEIDVKGREFDADLCEAVSRFAAGEDMQGKVVDVVQTGYMLGDKVLRFAQVVVGEEEDG